MFRSTRMNNELGRFKDRPKTKIKRSFVWREREHRHTTKPVTTLRGISSSWSPNYFDQGDRIDPMDYDCSAHDGFGNQIRSSNARCQEQEEKRVRFMMNRGGKSKSTHDMLAKYSKLTKGRPSTAGLVRSPTKSANPVMDRLGWTQNGRRPKSGQRTRRPQTAGGAMKHTIGKPPSLKQFRID